VGMIVRSRPTASRCETGSLTVSTQCPRHATMSRMSVPPAGALRTFVDGSAAAAHLNPGDRAVFITATVAGSSSDADTAAVA
jgi:hypothetical protein